VSTLVNPLAKRALKIHERLLGFYGEPIWRNPLPAIDELVSTILSQNTNDLNRDRAFNSLRAKFGTWEEVRDAEAAEVVNAIRPAGLANQKGPRIQQVLRSITEERGSLDLSFLGELPVVEARAWLTKFNGVGPKTAAIVLCFSLGKPAFPVDTHIYRVTGRIGLRPERMTVEQAHPHLESLFPPETYYTAHLNIIRLGREICTARKPYCEKCPIIKLCDYGMNVMSLRAAEGSEATSEPGANGPSQISKLPRRRKDTGGSQ
jgi:endonuclease-3